MKDIRSFSGDAAFVLDPFLGSGTTLLAAEGCERVRYGVEINPRYVDLIIERWQSSTFEKVASMRLGGDAAEEVRAA